MKIIHNLTNFFNEKTCQAYIHQLRWQDRPLQCPRCQSQKVSSWGVYHRKKGLWRYMCRECHRTFNDLTHTIFDKSHLPLACWILAAFLMALGSSSRRIGKEISTTIKTAYHKAWSLRNLGLSYEVETVLQGIVEADEIYQTAGQKGQAPIVGGKKFLESESESESESERGPRKRGRKNPPGRGHYDKDTPAIITFFARKGKAVFKVVRDFTFDTVQRVALQAVKVGSTVFTDSAKSYRILSQIGFLHDFVNHSIGEYVREDVHENGAEGLFSLLKPYLWVFRGVSKENLPAYCGFFQFLLNHRHLTAFKKAELLLYAGLDPKVAFAARKGKFAQRFNHSLLLHPLIN